MNQKRYNTIISFVLLTILIFPTSMFSGSIADRILKNSLYISYSWAIVVFLTNKYYKEKILFPVWLFLTAGAAATILNLNAFSVFGRLFLNTFSGVVISFYYIKIMGSKGIKNISFLFAAFLIINALTRIGGGSIRLYTSSLVRVSFYRTYYFLGIRVSISNLLIFSVALSLLISLYSSTKIKLFLGLGIIAGVYFVIIEAVSTAIVTLLTFIIVWIATKIIRSTKMWRNISIFLFLIAVLFYFVSVNPEIFEWFLIGFLDETLTFNGRTGLWEQAIDGMHGWHWILGNGMRGAAFVLSSTVDVDTAHSQYLNILYYFGLFGLLSYFLLLYRQFTIVGKVSEQRIRSILIAANIAIVVMGIPTTTFNQVYMFIYYVIVCMLPDVLKKEEIKLA